jgi:hypothetical protein
MICYAVLPRVFCQFRVKNGAANCMSLFLFYFPKELHADGQHTHRHTRVSPQVYRSSTCERRDQPQLRLTRKNVITNKYNSLTLKLADEIETIWCEESARWFDRWFECERRILILNLNSRRNKNLYHRWTADAFVISLDVQPHIIMWDYYSHQKGPPRDIFFILCVAAHPSSAGRQRAYPAAVLLSLILFRALCTWLRLAQFPIGPSLSPPTTTLRQPSANACCCVGCSLYAICIRTRWVGRPWHQIEVAARNTLPLSSSGHRMKALILRLYTYIVTLSNVALDLENVTMATIWSINSFYNVSISSSICFILFN